MFTYQAPIGEAQSSNKKLNLPFVLLCLHLQSVLPPGEKEGSMFFIKYRQIKYILKIS